MNSLITDLIVWLSPFLAMGFLWFLHNLISDVKDQITQTKGQIGGVKEELIQVGKYIVKIQSDIEYLKDRDKIEKEKTDKFENHVVKILRDAKGRFE